MYTFEKIDDATYIYDTSKLMNLNSIPSPTWVEEEVLVYGKLLNLFGAPRYEFVNIEEQYEYVIKATAEDGQIYYLTAYSGSTGASIGGHTTVEGIEDVALALINEIQAATPVDYSYEGYYFDGPAKISKGIKNGEAYFVEEPMTDHDEVIRIMQEMC